MRWVWLVVVGCGRVSFDPIAAPFSADAQRSPDDSLVVIGDATFPQGLVAYFPMDSTAPDDIVGGGVGSCTGSACPTVIAGYRDSALQFDGVNDYIVISDYPALDQPTPTIALRAFLGANAQDTAITAKRVDQGANSEDSWELGAGAGDELDITTSHGTIYNDQLSSPSGDLMTGRWQHLAFTADGATTRVYVDGVMRTSRAAAGTLFYDTNNAYFGCDDNGGPVRFFRGAIDDIQIYNRPLSAQEIADLAAL